MGRGVGRRHRPCPAARHRPDGARGAVGAARGRLQGRSGPSHRAVRRAGAQARARTRPPARRAGDRGRVVRPARRSGRGQLRQPLAENAEVPRHRRRSLAASAGRARPDRRHRAAYPGDPRPGGALARTAAHDAGDRRRLDRLAARDARIAVGHRGTAARQDRAARSRPRHGRAELGGARRIASAVRPARAPEGARPRTGRGCRLAGQQRLGTAPADHRADAAGRNQRRLVAPAGLVARAHDTRRLRHAAPGSARRGTGTARDPEGRRPDRRPGHP